MRKPAFIAAVLLLSACTAPHLQAPPLTIPPDAALVPAKGLSFTVEPGTAAPGSSVTLVLRNGTQRHVGYNLCSSALERVAGTGPLPGAGDGVCTMELRSLQPGQEVRYSKRLSGDLPAGEYRFRTGVELQSNRAGLDQIYSESFTVRR